MAELHYAGSAFTEKGVDLLRRALFEIDYLRSKRISKEDADWVEFIDQQNKLTVFPDQCKLRLCKIIKDATP